jgi:hypothetical protein
VRRTPAGSIKGRGSCWRAGEARRRRRAQGIGATVMSLGQGRPWRSAAGLPYVEGTTGPSGGCRSKDGVGGPDLDHFGPDLGLLRPDLGPGARVRDAGRMPRVGVRPWRDLVLSEEFGGCLPGRIGGGRWVAALGHVGVSKFCGFAITTTKRCGDGGVKLHGCFPNSSCVSDVR